MDWTADIDGVLNSIRINSLLLSNKHKTRYFELRDSLKWYRLPVIVLNGANSIISVGLQPYATQGAISITTSLIALLCGIIGAIELFFGIQKRLESDMIAQRDYYILSVDIFKTFSLAKHNRPIPAKDYLEKSYNTYRGLIESSNTLARRIDDQLLPLALGDVPHVELEASIAEREGVRHGSRCSRSHVRCYSRTRKINSHRS